LNIKNSDIDIILKNLREFKNNVLEIREDIKKINFDEIIFRTKNKNHVYTKKFLYNILINVIFN